MDNNLKLMLREHVRTLYEVMTFRVKLARRQRTLKQKALGYGAPRVHHAVASAKTSEDRLRADIIRALVSFDIWPTWLKSVKGIGPVLGGMLIAETNIEECTTVSKMWAWWGLTPASGGSSYRRHRVSKVLGESLLRKKTKPYYQEYLRYKMQKEHAMQPCMGCGGSGKHGEESCANCAGTGQGPWGKSQNHRHAAARRYMVKVFLKDFWQAWRRLEDLPCPEPYRQLAT